MTAAGTVRAARVELARALMEAGRDAEAAAELRVALDEPGADPPDWRIHLELGVLAERAGGEPLTALAEVLTAAISSPPADAEEPARLALKLLETEAAHEWAPRLESSQVHAVVARAQADPTLPAMVGLAAQLSLLTGDLETAGSLISSTSDEGLRADPAIGTAQAVATALRLVDEGDFRSALAVLDERAVSGEEPAAASTRAMALYGVGQVDDALACVARAPVTFETAMVQALVWLRRAGEGSTGESSVDPIVQAGRVASSAARLEPSLGDALLLRAQVELEGAHDIEGGRRLLEQAVRRLESDPDRARLWQLQRRVREDDAFRYMQLEVAAACGDQESLLGVRLEDLPFVRTAFSQDAAMAGLVARALQDAGRPQEAADFFDAAAGFHTNNVDAEGALRARHSAAEAHLTARRVVALADEQWQASYRREAQGRGAAEQAIDDGLVALDDLESSPVELQPSERIEAAYMRGLLLARRAGLGATTLVNRWRSLPWLLAAAVHEPNHSYRAAHLAWALNDAGLARPALHFAERALRLGEHDPWLREVAVVMRINWLGVLDPSTSQLLDEFDVDEWVATVRLSDALNRDDVSGVGEYLEHATFNALWARVVRAEGITRLHGLPAGESAYRAILEEVTKDPVNYLVASEAALILRDADAARHHIHQGLSEGLVDPRTAAFRGGLADLASGRAGAVDELRGLVGNAIDPSELREWAYTLFPILTQAWSENADVVAALEELQREAEAGVHRVDPLAPLTIEIDRGIRTSTDPALDEVVRELLHAEDQGGVADAAIAGELRRLAADPRIPSNVGAVLVATAAP